MRFGSPEGTAIRTVPITDVFLSERELRALKSIDAIGVWRITVQGDVNIHVEPDHPQEVESK